jgi:hypothetical protein
MGKHLSDIFAIQNGLEQGDALWPLLYNSAIRKVQGNQVGLKLYRTHKLLFYVDDINLLGDKIHEIKKTREALIDASKEVGLAVNADKIWYM